jgi:hypothetical protein
MSGLFGSAILDVAVGMVFVYLLVSLVVSAASELIASMLKWRATNLWQGINNLLREPGALEDKKDSGLMGGLKRLLQRISNLGGGPEKPEDKKNSDSAPMAAALYDHPLVKRLAQPGKLPSYIPSRTFVLVLLDLVSNPAKALKAELLKLTDGIGETSVKDKIQKEINEIPDSGLSMADLKKELSDLISSVPDNEVKSKMEGLINKIPSDASDIAALINLFPNEDVRTSLRVLWEESEHNIERLKENIEVWFNNAMDRVSGWYKRKSQLVNFIIAIVIAVWVNIDSEIIAKRLSTDSTLRTALVAQAGEYAKQPSNTPPANTPPAQPAAGAGQPAPGAQPQAPQNAEEITKEIDRRKKEVNDRIEAIKKLGLPIGYQREGTDKDSVDPGLPVWPGSPLKRAWIPFRGQPLTFNPFDWNAIESWGKLFPEHGFGWLFTAIAASLGAPFWFDILNKIITIRSAGKAPEEKPKSPKEEPKPLGPGQTPEEKRAAEQATTALIAGVAALTHTAASQGGKTTPAEEPPTP